MRTWARIVAFCLGLSLIPLAEDETADAKQKAISGRLSKSGYTVLAVSEGGTVTSVVANRGRFKLPPPNKRVTLHLRAPNGTYAGPLVVRSAAGGRGQARSARHKGKKGMHQVIVGVRAGASLGKVKVNPGKGFALARAVAATSLDSRLTATAKKGVPIGAGNFGRVRVKKLKGPNSDRDRDGIPASLDIDDDGDLVLDDVDANEAGAASALKAQQQGELGAFSNLGLGLTGGAASSIVNANAPGLSDEQIQSGLRTRGRLQISPPSGFSGELDCGALVYCTAGGTGRRLASQFDPNPQPFPACCDPDGDGLGSIEGINNGLGLLTGAGADQIRAGDLLLAQGTVAGGQQELAGTLNTIFVTAPAIASYVDELGATHAVPSPTTPSTVLDVVDGPDPGSEVSVTLTFWRPQRTPVPGELPSGAGKWVDIGGLQHLADSGGLCPQSSYAENDPNLTLGSGPIGGSASGIVGALLLDSALDQAASPTNTFTYTLNLSACAAAGVGGSTTFNPGEARNFDFSSALPPGPVPGPLNAAGSNYTFRNQT